MPLFQQDTVFIAVGTMQKMYFALPPAPGRGVSGCVVVGKRGGWFRSGAGGWAI